MGFSRDKLIKHQVLAKSGKVSSALLKTSRFKEKNFHKLLKACGKVAVKPSNGWGGKGVIFVSAAKGGVYKVQYENKKKKLKGLSAAYKWVRKKTGGTKHIVQQKISLATVGGRPFDLRVMVQKKNKKSDWKVTGKLAKIAGSGYLVTNIKRSHGKVTTVSEAVRRSNIRGTSIPRLEKRINTLSVAAAKVLRKHYGIRKCGLDIGLDTKGRVWIIEANFHPDNGLFLKLKDKSMYKRIRANL